MWGALGLLVSYSQILNATWDSWPIFFGTFAAAAVACLLYAATVDRDELLGREDSSMVNLGRYLTIAQLILMLVTLIGLWLDPNRQLLSTADPEWVANNIFAAGAIALTAVSGYALLRDTAYAEAQASEAL
jgi:anaerobic C4-dicarboxylate transporter